MLHQFETHNDAGLDFAPSDRLHHDQLLEERRQLCTPAFLVTTEALEGPVLFFNETRQLVHANPAAIAAVGAPGIDAVIGLRMGELLGCDHQMEDAACNTPGACQHCNNMAAIVSALAGVPVRQEMRLVLHPRSNTRRSVYDVSSIPVPVGDLTFAMVTLQPLA